METLWNQTRYEFFPCIVKFVPSSKENMWTPCLIVLRKILFSLQLIPECTSSCFGFSGIAWVTGAPFHDFFHKISKMVDPNKFRSRVLSRLSLIYEALYTHFNFKKNFSLISYNAPNGWSVIFFYIRSISAHPLKWSPGHVPRPFSYASVWVVERNDLSQSIVDHE